MNTLMKKASLFATAAALIAPALLSAQTRGKVVEEIIARVNNDIITLTEYEKAQVTLRHEVAQDCPTCQDTQLETQFKDRRKDLLRDLIDQSLLVQRAKDVGVSVETELIRRLDQIRQQNNLPSMEELEKKVEESGIAWEEFKTNLRNTLMTQEVIRHEVASRIDVGTDEVKKYYQEHKREFDRPEQVYLSEILVTTEGKSEQELPALEKKAQDLLTRVKKGEDFTELARRYSDGATAKQGGELGAFERGQLSKQIDDAVFKLNRGEMTGVIQTKTGFEILKVLEHFQAGEQPLEKVEPEIMSKLSSQKMQPALREFLATLREESYLTIKPGYVDTAGVGGASTIQETAPTPDAAGGKKSKKHKKSRTGQ